LLRYRDGESFMEYFLNISDEMSPEDMERLYELISQSNVFQRADELGKNFYQALKESKDSQIDRFHDLKLISASKSFHKLDRGLVYLAMINGIEEEIKLSNSILFTPSSEGLPSQFFVLGAKTLGEGANGKVKIGYEGSLNTTKKIAEVEKVDHVIKIQRHDNYKPSKRSRALHVISNIQVENELTKILYPESLGPFTKIKTKPGGGYDFKDYIIMPRLPGVSVDKIDCKKLSTSEKLDMAMAMLREVQRVHRAGYIHNDIKPGNFLYDAENKRAYIIDFGSARKIKSDSPFDFHGDLKDPADYKGSPLWSSPEYVVNYRSSIQSDICSLGSTMIHIFSGGSIDKKGNLSRPIQKVLVPRGGLSNVYLGTIDKDDKSKLGAELKSSDSCYDAKIVNKYLAVKGHLKDGISEIVMQMTKMSPTDRRDLSYIELQLRGAKLEKLGSSDPNLVAEQKQKIGRAIYQLVDEYYSTANEFLGQAELPSVGFSESDLSDELIQDLIVKHRDSADTIFINSIKSCIGELSSFDTEGVKLNVDELRDIHTSLESSGVNNEDVKTLLKKIESKITSSSFDNQLFNYLEVEKGLEFDDMEVPMQKIKAKMYFKLDALRNLSCKYSSIKDVDLQLNKIQSAGLSKSAYQSKGPTIFVTDADTLEPQAKVKEQKLEKGGASKSLKAKK